MESSTLHDRCARDEQAAYDSHSIPAARTGNVILPLRLAPSRNDEDLIQLGSDYEPNSEGSADYIVDATEETDGYDPRDEAYGSDDSICSLSEAASDSTERPPYSGSNQPEYEPMQKDNDFHGERNIWAEMEANERTAHIVDQLSRLRGVPVEIEEDEGDVAMQMAIEESVLENLDLLAENSSKPPPPVYHAEDDLPTLRDPPMFPSGYYGKSNQRPRLCSSSESPSGTPPYPNVHTSFSNRFGFLPGDSAAPFRQPIAESSSSALNQNRGLHSVRPDFLLDEELEVPSADLLMRESRTLPVRVSSGESNPAPSQVSTLEHFRLRPLPPISESNPFVQAAPVDQQAESIAPVATQQQSQVDQPRSSQDMPPAYSDLSENEWDMVSAGRRSSNASDNLASGWSSPPAYSTASEAESDEFILV